MNDDDDTINLKNKQLKNVTYTIDEDENENENEVIEIENNINDLSKNNDKNMEKYENLQMSNNDININKVFSNECIQLNFLENNISKIENNLEYENISINLIKLEESIKFIDKSKYIIDDESDEIKSEKEEKNISNENIKNLFLTKKNFEKFNSIKSNIQIYGCSHCRCFYRKDLEINNIYIYNNFKSAASISGIVNDISSLNYKKIISNKIISNPFDYHIFKIGQIDAEYIYYYKILQNVKISKENFFKDIIYKFLSYLKNFIDKYGSKVIICGSNLASPTNWIDNTKSILGINKLPKNLSYEEKNENILLFNSILKKECKINNIKYFDLTKDCSFKNNNNLSIKKKYIGKDYHYKGAENDDIYNKQHQRYGINTHWKFLNILVQNL